MLRRLGGAILLVLLGGALSTVGAEDEGPTTPLRILAEITAGPAVSGRPIELEATFEAWGDEQVQLYIPPHVPTVRFPTWRFAHADGRVFTPAQPAFQSMWPDGLMGKIITLPKGERRTFPTRASHFLELDAELNPKPGAESAPLPPGMYSVYAEYRQATTQLPYGKPRFQTEFRDHPEIFTGSIRSSMLELEVTEGTTPLIQLKAPRVVEAGAAFPLEILVRRAKRSTVPSRGTLRVYVGSKGRGACSAWFRVQAGKLKQVADDGSPTALGIEPGGTLEATLDLSTLRFGQVRGSKRVFGGLYELIPTGGVHISVQWRHSTAVVVAGAGLQRAIKAPSPTQHAHLRVRVEKVTDRTSNPEVDVILENVGTEPVRVPASLSYGSHLYFSMVDEHKPDEGVYRIALPAGGLGVTYAGSRPGPQAKIAAGLSWAGEAFEAAPLAAAQTYLVLAPGSELRRRFDLGELIADKPGLWGRYLRVTAWYRNHEPGRYLGLDSVFTGLLDSEPVVVRGREW